MKLHFYLILALCYVITTPIISQAQFRSPANPHYWKNKSPYTGYWQQDVAYRITADIDETTDIITGTEHLMYYNNSPDTLSFVFFNLYQNAFQPGSYLDDLERHNGVKPKYGKYERNGQGIAITSLRAANGDSLMNQIDNTVMKVWLPKPLLPNDSTAFNMSFQTFYDNGDTRRRMKKYKAYGATHYNGCQWYPKLCVYDHKAGWNTDQHLNREFYGDFGSFDVSLTFASNYVVESTGMLQNESEVLPDSLKVKLQIRNFKDKKWEEKPSIITPFENGKRKTWIYHADNVHDFAFTADPSYRIADTVWNGIHCTAICQESHAAGWQSAAAYCMKVIRCFSTSFGMYEYPKMVVADAADGMEYPMLTLDGGREPDYHQLLAHEIGHNWFYGMLGNNETYRAMMDEGFTQFITSWGIEHIDGDTPMVGRIKNFYARRFYEPPLVRDQRVYMGYLSDATIYNDEPINTHSDMFNGALSQGGGYRHVYSKTATMLYNLQYVLGDSVFLTALRHYVAQWKFEHPYPEDFRNSVSQFTHIDLNWFFDEWMETTKNIDYKIVSVHKTKENHQYRIKLKRKGRMQMPIDLRVVERDGSFYDYHIPNTWFTKNLSQPLDSHTTPEFINGRSRLLPKWYGWDKLKPTYTAVVSAPHGIRNVIIDPSERLADINQFNNRLRGNVRFGFDAHYYPATGWRKYRLWMRPDIWYNALDGIKLGFVLKGNYMGVKHVFQLQVWGNTRLGQGGFYSYSDYQKSHSDQISYNFHYHTALDKLLKGLSIYINSRYLDGYVMDQIGLGKRFPSNFSLDINIKGFTRSATNKVNYLDNPSDWSTVWLSPVRYNASMNITASYLYNNTPVAGLIVVHLRTASLMNYSSYHYLELTHINRLPIWRLDLRTRIYGRVGWGGYTPLESSLYLAGANPEDMMENKYTRSAAFFPQSWTTYTNDRNHFHYGGGLNMRGYAGYGNIMGRNSAGESGWAVNGELDFSRILKIRKAKLSETVGLHPYLFGDMGAIVSRNSTTKASDLGQILADAGVGVALSLKKFGLLQDIKPLTIRFDFPFYLSDPNGSTNWAMRWKLGINRAF